MNRFFSAVFVVILVCLLVPCHGLAQSVQEGVRLWQEANKLAGKAQTKEDVKPVVEKYTLALKVFEQVGFKQGIAMVATGLGNLYLRQGEGESIEQFEKALAIARELLDRKSETIALNNLGRAYYRFVQHDKAVEYFEKALAIKTEVPDRDFERVVLMNLGQAYHQWGNIEEVMQEDKKKDRGLSKYQRALEIFQRLQSDIWQGETLFRLGFVYNGLEEPQKAVECLVRAAESFKRSKSHDKRAQALAMAGHFDKSDNVKHYEQALESYQTIGDAKGQAEMLHYMALCHQVHGQYQAALECSERELEVHRKTNDTKVSFEHDESYVLSNIGHLAEDLGQYQKALEAYEQYLEIKRKADNKKEESWGLTPIARVYEKLGQYQKALECAEKSLEINQSIDEPTLFHSMWRRIWLHLRRLGRGGYGYTEQGRALETIAHIYVATGKYDDALIDFERARDKGAPASIIEQDIINLYLEKGELDKAEVLLNANRLTSSNAVTPEEKFDLANLERLRARFYLLKGDYARVPHR